MVKMCKAWDAKTQENVLRILDAVAQGYNVQRSLDELLVVENPEADVDRANPNLVLDIEDLKETGEAHVI